jgi:hypothetical protein
MAYEYKFLELQVNVELRVNSMSKEGWRVIHVSYYEEDDRWNVVMERKLPDEHPPLIPHPVSRGKS